MNNLRISLILLATLTLSACSAYKENFKCRAQEGLGCRSISEVNNLINKGWPSPNALKKNDEKKSTFFSRLFKRKSAQSAQPSETVTSETRDNFLNRHSEETLRIWIAPYQAENNYWDEQFVYRSIAPTHGQSLNQLAKDKEAL